MTCEQLHLLLGEPLPEDVLYTPEHMHLST